MQAATRLEQGWVSQMQNAALGNMADQVPPLVPGVEIEEGKVPQWGSGSAGAFCRYVCITPSPDLSPSLCLCIRFRSLLLYTVGVLFQLEWCIRQAALVLLYYIL